MNWLTRQFNALTRGLGGAWAWIRACFPVQEHADPRIPDEFYSRLIQMYRTRAIFWRSVGLCSLLLTAATIFVGFTIFLRGDPAQDRRAESEIQLSVELAGERRKLTEISSSGARTLAQSGIANRAAVLAEILGRLSTTLTPYVANPSQTQLPRLNRVVDANLRILRALDSMGEQTEDSKRPQDAVIDVSDFFPNDSKVFATQTLELLQSEIRATGESPKTVLASLERLSASIAVEPTAEEIEELKILAESPSIEALDEVDRRIEAREKDASLALESWQRNAPVREEQRQAIDSNIADIEEQLGEVRAERDKILFMSWVPDLTLRVGAVVLLLFLTQILLGAYRYTISLSTFYLARADAIQLLQPQAGDATWYNIEHLEKLLANLSPDAISIESVKSPTDQVVDLATTWIKQKGK